MSTLLCVTGKSGSGKSTFAKKLAQRFGYLYVDVDKIGHDALVQEEILKKLTEIFGREILDNSGYVIRKKLGKIVFNSKEKMDILTDLTWSYMEKTLDTLINATESAVVIDWILLPQTKYWEICEYKILIESDREVRKNIVLKRDGITSEYFEERDSASIDYNDYKKDYIFYNDYLPETIEKMIDKFKFL